MDNKYEKLDSLKFAKRLLEQEVVKGITMDEILMKIDREISVIKKEIEYYNSSTLALQIGQLFISWAEIYFKENDEMFLDRNSVYKDFILNNPYYKNITQHGFKKKIRQMCELKNWRFNPKIENVYMANDGRYIKWKDGSACEFFYIQTTPKH